MTLPRSFPVFAITFACAFAVLYFAATAYNLALFTYDAATSEFFFLVRRTGLDLPMYWYGWIVTSAIGASVAGVIASLIPKSVGPTTVVRLVVGHPDGRNPGFLLSSQRLFYSVGHM